MPAAPRRTIVLPLVAGLVVLAATLASARANAGWPAGGMRLSLSDSAAYTPVVAGDGGGGVIVAWFDHRDVDLHVYATRRLADGSVPAGWQPGGVALAGDIGTDPDITSDGEGGAYVGWKYFGDVAIQHITASGVVGGDWYLPNGVTLPGRSALNFPGELSPEQTEHSKALHAYVVADPGVGVVGVYSNEGRFFRTAFARKAYRPGSTVPPTDAAYGIIDPAHYDMLTAIGVDDGAHGVLVAWSTYPGVLVRRYAEDGSAPAGWPANQGVLALGSPTSYSRPLGLCSDGAGGAFVVQSDSEAVPGDLPLRLRIQHVTAGGVLAPGWPADGIAIASTPHEAGLLRGNDVVDGQRHSIVADGAGGALVAWTDLRTDGGDVYAARIRADGTLAPGWSAGGRNVASGPGVQRLPQLAPDGGGGAYLAWVDLGADAQGDLVATHLTGDGVPAPGWPAGGRVVAGGAGGILNARLTADDDGAAYVAWADTRGGRPEIRLARLDPGGVSGVPHGGSAPSLRSISVRPDPWREEVAVSFTLDRVLPVRLELIDVTGRRCAGSDLGALGAGEHVARLRPERVLPAGVYLMRVRAGDTVSSARAVHLR